MNKHRKHYVKAALAALAATTAVGFGAFASFSDTETVTRNVDAGAIDITVGPEMFSVSDMAPGDIFSRGMVIDIPEPTNEGDLITALTVNIENSVVNSMCGEVNPECENAVASLLDGNALTAGILACPAEGQISDAAPAVDDDGDPATDARYDGPGPYTCSTGDFAVPVSNFPMAYEDTVYDGYRWAGHDDEDFELGPWAFGADFYETGRTYTYSEWEMPPYDPSLPPPEPELVERTAPVGVFIDGTTIEAVTCIKMPDDIFDVASYYSSSVDPDPADFDLEDNDYENLSADIVFDWTAHQRPGIVLPPEPEPGEPWFPSSTDCASMLAGDVDYPDDSDDPDDPDDYEFDGDNTIAGRVWNEDVNTWTATPNHYDPSDPDDEVVVGYVMELLNSAGESLATTTTDSNGWYSFSDVRDGTYILRTEHLSNAWYMVEPNAWSDDSVDSDFVEIEVTPYPTYSYRLGEATVQVSGGEVVELWAGFGPAPG